jgi:hypothetical protein
MKRITWILAATLAAAPLAQAELYKYVDKDGKTVYSDQPPTDSQGKQVRTLGAGSAGAPKTAVEKDKDQDKLRKEAREKQDKADKSAKTAEEQEKACTQARTNHRAYAEGGRLYKYDEKGERVFMSDAEIDSEKERARASMDDACRKS